MELPEKIPLDGRTLFSDPWRGNEALKLGIIFLIFVGIFILGLFFKPESASSLPAAIGALATFILVGGILVWKGTTKLRKEKLKKKLVVKFPNEPWQWDSELIGYKTTTGDSKTLLRAFSYLGFFLVFASPFFFLFLVAFVAYIAGGSIVWNAWIISIGAGLFFACIFAYFTISILYLILRQMKYGSSHIKFTRFPYFSGGEFTVYFANRRLFQKVSRATATIRFLKEVIELVEHEVKVSPRSSRRKKQKVEETFLYQVYSNQKIVEWTLGAKEIPIIFQLPGQYGNKFESRSAQYWELELKSETSGVDFCARFLLPVYLSSNDFE